MTDRLGQQPGGSRNSHQTQKMSEFRVYTQGDREDEFFTLQIESKFRMDHAMDVLNYSLQNAIPSNIRRPRMKDYVQIYLERTCGIELDLRERLNARKRAASHLYRPMPDDYWIEDGSTQPFGGIFVGLNRMQTIDQIFQRITEVYRGDLRSEIRFEVRGLLPGVDRLRVIERFNLERQRILSPQFQQLPPVVDFNEAFIVDRNHVDNPRDPEFIEPIVPDRAYSPDGSEPQRHEFGVNIQLTDEVNHSNFSLTFERRLTINENIQVLADALQCPEVDRYLRFYLNMLFQPNRDSRGVRLNLASNMANARQTAITRALADVDRAVEQGNTRKIEDATRRVQLLTDQNTIPFAVYSPERGRDDPSYYLRIDRNLSLRVSLRILQYCFTAPVEATLFAVNALQGRMTQAEVTDRFRWRMCYARYRRGMNRFEDNFAELRLAVFPKLNLPPLQPPSPEWQRMEPAANLREEQERIDELNYEMMYGGPRRPDYDYDA